MTDEQIMACLIENKRMVYRLVIQKFKRGYADAEAARPEQRKARIAKFPERKDSYALGYMAYRPQQMELF